MPLAKKNRHGREQRRDNNSNTTKEKNRGRTSEKKKTDQPLLTYPGKVFRKGGKENPNYDGESKKNLKKRT